ncbi:helix-turn-helix domain-containing protein [Corynebacterium sp. CNCTC7651]|uniref:PucR family transcriptional regulator n=1 Tax=Corynebacterium sp. CNCTC7651 TaxID=2815361 RepID=UPI001F17EE8E|nr:PucR family transcriptional regulator [Corynebacterium sp. CNCTC7651]UIZ91417.1 helix-turn-helix domain-containing protein [Corynebacterium sp. CNCTC7651]
MPSSVNQELREFLPVFRSSLANVAAETATEIIETLDSYKEIDVASLRESCERNIEQAITALRSGASPSPGEMHIAEVVAQSRFNSGLPVEQMILGYRVSLQNIHSKFVETGKLRLSAEAFATGSKILWQVGDAFLVRSVVAFQDLESNKLESELEKRARAMSAVLAGEAPPTALSRLGLIENGTYAVLRVALSEDPMRMRGEIERGGSLPGMPAAVVAAGPDLVAVIAAKPEIDFDCVAAIGSFQPLQNIKTSDLEARHVLEASRRLGKKGLHDIAKLSWRLAVSQDKLLGRYFMDRFVAPLQSDSWGLLRTVTVWIDSGFSYSKAAGMLFVHENTVRYRVDKFCQMTGMDRNSFDDWVGVKWAIELVMSEGEQA